MNVLSLFDGISCGRVALERAGIPVDNYFASEIDKNAIKVSEDNYPDIIRLGSVENWREWDLPKIDLVLAGSPCQGFSYAGNQLAFDDPRSKLFFTFVDILHHYQPEFYLLENVRMKKEFSEIINDTLGAYSAVLTEVINSRLVSAQNRVRQYWTNMPINQPDDRGIMLQDIVPDACGVYTYPRGWNKGGINRRAVKCPCITTSAWQHNFFWTDYLDIKHKFTPEMCEEFQTLPLGYTKAVSPNQRYKLLGNGWTVDVIAHILKGLR